MPYRSLTVPITDEMYQELLKRKEKTGVNIRTFVLRTLEKALNIKKKEK